MTLANKDENWNTVVDFISKHCQVQTYASGRWGLCAVRFRCCLCACAVSGVRLV